VVGVQDLDLVVDLDVPRADLTRPLLVDADELGLGAVGLDHDLLEVQHDVGDVFDDVRHRGELVERAVDLHGRDGRALKRGEQHATKAVAQRDAEAALERL
jgi:hypothetical protein